jgi:Uma2 family endonuclease
MPNGDLVAPDVAFVSAVQLRESPRAYADTVPELVVEVKSSTDSLKKLQAKLERFLEMGSRVGVLIDPDKHAVKIYRPGAEPVELGDGDTLAFPDILPGWEIQVTDLWPLVF